MAGGSVSAATPTEGNEDSPEIVDSGECGDNLDWTLDSNGLLIINGIGDMDLAPFDNIKAQIKEVQVKDGVTSIGNFAFRDCTGLRSLTLPEGITSIGEAAFQRCTSLTSLALPEVITGPEGITSIGRFAFQGCTGLRSLTLPEGITSIGEFTFEGCTGLTSLTLPEGITSIGEFAFAECSGLTSITLPKSLTHIGRLSFYESLAYTVYIGTEGERYAEEIKAPNITRLCTEDTHQWKETERKEPTCTEPGYAKFVCERTGCTETKTDILNPSPEGHKWKESYTTDKPATCVTAGSRSIRCTNPGCHAVKPGSQTTIPAKGHLWDEGVITKAPTCTEPGIRTCTCERCKWTLRKEVAPTGHTYAGEITKATFTKDGAVSGVCEDCGAFVQREVIPQVSDVELSHTEYTYNGTNRQPKIVLKDRTGKELKPEEYSVVYPKESKVPGTYELTITLKGNFYEGTLTKAYTVKKGNQVIGLSDMTKRIDSKTVTLKAEILQGNKTGRFGYQSSNPEVASVTSWGRVTFHKVGKVEITAMTRGSANYNSAQKTITLTVAPVPTAVTKLQSQNPGKLNIQYRANPDADGYQIQYGTSPDMKGAKYAAVENAAIRSYTRKDVKSGEIYYVRVRTYNVVDGERIYSNWSGIKSAEVK